jgi:ankyrin repeat protein
MTTTSSFQMSTTNEIHYDNNRQTTILQFFHHLRSGDLDQVKQFVERDKSLINERTQDEWAYTPLLWAAQMGRFHIVKYLLDMGADYRLYGKKIKWKPILIACRYGHVDIVRLLLDRGDNVNIRLEHENEFTPLHYAAQYGCSDLARLLLDRGADYTLVGGLGLRPIHTAANHGKIEIIRILLEYGENVNILHSSEWKYSPLHWAVQENQYEACNFLLQNGAQVNLKTGKNFLTPLMQASRKGFTKIAHLLIKYGADYMITSPLGLRSIHIAACYGHTDIIRLLLEYGEDVNILHSSEWRYSPLHWAVQHGHYETAKFLLENGCNMHIRSGKIPRTAMDLARKNDYPHIVQLLKAFRLREIDPIAKILMANRKNKKFTDIEFIFDEHCQR